MAATEAQIEALKRAREARAIKKTLGIVDVPKICEPQVEAKSVWLQGLLTSMSNKSATHYSHVESCVPLADEVLRLYNEKFK